MMLSRIRELRLEQGLTLSQLSERAGVSTALLSQVERGLADPSLESLRRLAEALGLPLFDLFRASDAERVAVIRADNRRRVAAPQGQIVFTQVSRSGGQLEVLEAVMEPESVSSAEPWSHSSEECILLLEGDLVVEVDGTEYALRAGDSCHFESIRPHRFLNPYKASARFIVSVTPPSN